MIRLHSQQVAATLQHIHDPDPYISCDLMDGRDAFLTMARDKHQEFSSLRRAKFSTLALLYELHNQQKDNFVYTCNTCKAHVETRWHCTVCEVSTFVSIKQKLINCGEQFKLKFRDFLYIICFCKRREITAVKYFMKLIFFYIFHGRSL